jgi:hypothetical protein
VISSTLSLRKANSVGAGTVSVHTVLAPWAENTITWNSFGGMFDPPALASFSPNAIPAGGFANVDLTAVTQAWVSGAAPNYGVLLAEPGPPRAAFGSSEAPLLLSRPSLAICFMAGE